MTCGSLCRCVLLVESFCVLCFFFFKQKTAYEMPKLLEFRRVLFRSPKGEPSLLREEPPELAPPPYGGISDAWQAGNVVPFLGAGASRIGQGEGSAALPSSAELADFLAVGVNYPSRLPHERDLARISSLYENLIGRPTLKSKLRGKLGPTGPDDQPRNFPHGDIHKLIAKQGGPRLIVTTNYDTLIEDAFIEAGRPRSEER